LVTGASLREGVRQPRFWLLNIALSMVVACVVTLVTNGVPCCATKA
jgi:hypothetical protein